MKKYKKTLKYSLLLVIALINIYAISEVPSSNAKYYKDNSESSVISLETYKYNYDYNRTYDNSDIKIVYYQNYITYEFNIDRNTAIYSGYDTDTYTFNVNNNNCSIDNNKIVYTNNNSDNMKVIVKCNIPNTTETFQLDVKEETTNSGIINFLSSDDITIDIEEYQSHLFTLLNQANDDVYQKFPYINNLTKDQKNKILEYIRTYIYTDNTLPGITYTVDSEGNYTYTFDNNLVGYALTYNSSINSDNSDNITRYEFLFSTTDNSNEILKTYLKHFSYSGNQINSIISLIDGMDENGLSGILTNSTTVAKTYTNTIRMRVIRTDDNIVTIYLNKPNNLNITMNRIRANINNSINQNVEINNYTIDNDTNIDNELSDKVIADEKVQDLIKNGNENKLPDFIDYTTIVDDKKIVLVIVYNATTDDEVSTFVRIIDFDSIEDSDILYLPINPTNNEFENLLKITNEDGSSVTYELLPAIDGDTGEYIYEENDNNIKCYKYSINKISE